MSAHWRLRCLVAALGLRGVLAHSRLYCIGYEWTASCDGSDGGVGQRAFFTSPEVPVPQDMQDELLDINENTYKKDPSGPICYAFHDPAETEADKRYPTAAPIYAPGQTVPIAWNSNLHSKVTDGPESSVPDFAIWYSPDLDPHPDLWNKSLPVQISSWNQCAKGGPGVDGVDGSNWAEDVVCAGEFKIPEDTPLGLTTFVWTWNWSLERALTAPFQYLTCFQIDVSTDDPRQPAPLSSKSKALVPPLVQRSIAEATAGNTLNSTTTTSQASPSPSDPFTVEPTPPSATQSDAAPQFVQRPHESLSVSASESPYHSFTSGLLLLLCVLLAACAL